MSSTTRVDFYILKGRQRRGTLSYACRLIAKAYQQKHQLFVYCNTPEESKQMDDLLWTYNDDSFIPHCLVNNAQINQTQAAVPIKITCQNIIPADFKDILINLHQQPFIGDQPFSRIIEFVSDDEPWRSLSRKKYVHYRDQKFELNTHEIG